jgi:cardiolipin synthase
LTFLDSWFDHDAWLILAALVQLGCAGAVTVHALLTKRDVGSAIAWIGVAWLSPFAGAGLYAMFGVNRVVRRARRLGRRRGEADEAPPVAVALGHLGPLCEAGGRVTGRPALDGNAVETLTHAAIAYPRMLEAISSAEQSIALSSYIFRGDAVGRAFMHALNAAHRRGVTVRVLVDGMGGGWLLAPAYRWLHRRGVPVARFLHTWLPWRMPLLNLRSHKKLLVVDGMLGFTGGLNIGAENLREANARDAVRDTHFMVQGPVVAQMMADFAEDWAFVTGELLAGPQWFPPLEAAGDATARVVTSGPDAELERIRTVMLSALGVAREAVWLATPYFVPDEAMESALALAALRGVRVDILLPGRSDHRLLDWSARASVQPLLEAGCRIWLGAPPFDHSKLMVVDGAWSLVGSANWDMRSLRLNFELNLETYDSALAAVLDAHMRTGSAHRLTLREIEARGLPVRLRDAAARLLLPYL